ncbi:MAG: FAD binding domain-containing protein [Ferruginibacter sp.]
MIQFILNNKEIKTALSPGLTLLDFIRYQQQLTGTKIGCREGDCGACSILAGEIKNDKLVYSSATSCLMPLGNAGGKHIVTIEGINLDGLNAMQEAFAAEGATQCGFCTPGFIVSLAGFCISEKEPSYPKAIDAMNGNICRCTGYKSIERAAATVNEKMQERANRDPLQFAVDNKMIPAYFLEIKERLQKIQVPQIQHGKNGTAAKFLGGGTDLYVQQHDTIVDEQIEFLFDKPALKGISQTGNTCEMGAAVTVTDIAESNIFKDHFPGLDQYIKLVSSTQIRNMATIAGNFTNASPIGDLTIFFLALNARLKLSDGSNSRQVFLKDFYKGYKSLDKTAKEIIEKIYFELPAKNDLFNFEKVCKRTWLDIASVNTAIHLKIDGGKIIAAGMSAGGVGPVPTYLSKCSALLIGKEITVELVSELVSLAQTEITPISDARGTEAYKRLLLSQLIKAHFIKLFPGLTLEHIIHS